MNYFSNQEIESQEIHDPELFQIVAWDRAHKDKLTPVSGGRYSPTKSC
jgi:hypothetical protein